jgi:2-polyprenyl-3-methyl-5-hydroxy-6-metoxy-1,4-benzoquinol methylase
MPKITCKICGQTRPWNKVATIQNHRENISYKEFEYYECPLCNFWILKPDLTTEQLYQIYQKEEYYEELSQEVESPLQKWAYSIKIYPGYDKFVTQYVPKDKTLLDIGCGNGEFLEKMRILGYEVTGIDPYPIAVKQTQKKIGETNVYQGYIKDLNQIPKSFDAITMWHVLEHVDNPIEDLKTIHDKLNPNGNLIFEVPNANSFSFKLFENNYCWNMVPEHINYFTPKSLEVALQNTEFEKIKIYTPPRALLNFTLSFKNYLTNRNLPPLLIKIATILCIPFSVLIGIYSASIDQGEVIRVVAAKK